MADLEPTVTLADAEAAIGRNIDERFAILGLIDHRELFREGGYGSFGDYVRDRLPVWDRRARVAALRSEGKSLRSIAGDLGVGVGTVHRDLAGVPGGTPDEITGLDGKKYRPVEAPKRVTSAALADLAAHEAVIEAGVAFTAAALESAPELAPRMIREAALREAATGDSIWSAVLELYRPSLTAALARLGVTP